MWPGRSPGRAAGETRMSDLPIYTEAIHSKGRAALANAGLQTTLRNPATRFMERRDQVVEGFSEWEVYRTRAHEIKREALDHRGAG